MPNILTKMNRRTSNLFKEEIKSETQQGAENALKMYEKYLENKETFEMFFDTCDIDGTLTRLVDGVLVVLPGNSVAEIRPTTNTYTVRGLMGVNLKVCVARIVPEEKKVYTALSGKIIHQGRIPIRNAIQTEIRKQIESGKIPRVWGIVKKIETHRVYVDIFDYGILGVVGIREWQDAYVRSLSTRCRLGDVLQFDIISPLRKIRGKEPAWNLSRKKIEGNPWEKIDFSNLHEGSVIMVKCMEIPEGKTYWWGVCDRTPGIDIMGNFTTKFSQKSGMFPGITYICKIDSLQINREKNIFKVVPFMVAGSDVEDFEKYRNMKNLRVDLQNAADLETGETEDAKGKETAQEMEGEPEEAFSEAREKEPEFPHQEVNEGDN